MTKKEGGYRGKHPTSRSQSTIGSLSLSEPEVKKLFSAITKLEDEALLRLAVSTGIRRGDIVRIKTQDVEDRVENGGGVLWVKFWERKKKRNWSVPVGGESRQKLLQHIDKLPKGTPWLFPSPYAYSQQKEVRLKFAQSHLASRTAYNIFQKWLAHAGIKARPFHALRATSVKLAQKKGWTVEQVMALTGDSYEVIRDHYQTPSEGDMEESAMKRPIA